MCGCENGMKLTSLATDLQLILEAKINVYSQCFDLSCVACTLRMVTFAGHLGLFLICHHVLIFTHRFWFQFQLYVLVILYYHDYVEH